jgi:hypothetical protein
MEPGARPVILAAVLAATVVRQEDRLGGTVAATEAGSVAVRAVTPGLGTSPEALPEVVHRPGELQGRIAGIKLVKPLQPVPPLVLP